MPSPRLPQPAKGVLVAIGQSQREVAEALGVNPHLFGRVLNCHTTPWPALRERLAEYLGLPAADLFWPEVSGDKQDSVSAAEQCLALERKVGR